MKRKVRELERNIDQIVRDINATIDGAAYLEHVSISDSKDSLELQIDIESFEAHSSIIDEGILEKLYRKIDLIKSQQHLAKILSIELLQFSRSTTSIW